MQEWEKCVNSLRVALDCDIYITGSNAKLLSGELATYLGGRYVEFVIYPFSFAEFLELYRTIAPEASGQQAFQKYLLAGGMPYLANLRYAEEPSRQYLTDVFNSVQLKACGDSSQQRGAMPSGSNSRGRRYSRSPFPVARTTEAASM